MKTCALLTMDNPSGFAIYDYFLHAPLNQFGWHYHTLSWRSKDYDWNYFDAVIIRSTWDYQDHQSEFLEVLNSIDQSSAILLNSLNTVKWNINKFYLYELAQNQMTIVPTLWPDCFSEAELITAFNFFKTERLIIKPRISANADNTFILTKIDVESNKYDLQKIFQKRQFMLQPFIQNVITEGEYSLFYFGGEFSHAILKKPKQGDFRVQEEYGGRLQKITPEKKLLQTGAQLNEYFGNSLLYARFDLVRDKNNIYIMEVELIEPSLYFNLDSLAANRFVAALERTMQQY